MTTTSADELEQLLRAAEPTDPRPLGGLIERLHSDGSLLGARMDRKAIGAAALGAIPIRALTQDSRAIGRGSLFVAVAGEHADGHDFIEKVRTDGAVAALVEHPVPGDPLPQLVVRATRPALADAAGW